ncbi:hypothetical protein [Noviherbaspirillum aerium]|uniref:hypothetical protein n=1 Tax=Noviherbaspirillum aerium TaxID=2588497 RepID=UPI00124CF523|nr:hypothetical protein [Noviherbaspirillum aerium]
MSASAQNHAAPCSKVPEYCYAGAQSTSSLQLPIILHDEPYWILKAAFRLAGIWSAFGLTVLGEAEKI